MSLKGLDARANWLAVKAASGEVTDFDFDFDFDEYRLWDGRVGNDVSTEAEDMVSSRNLATPSEDGNWGTTSEDIETQRTL
jgi:hypothetical protein